MVNPLLQRLHAGPLQGTVGPSITLVMPCIAWDEIFSQCAQAALSMLRPGDQALIVFDGTPPRPPDWLLASGAHLLNTGRRQGPAAARNLAAEKASGELLVFVDADVALHADALDRFRAHFATYPQLAAVFGGYDDQPVAPGLVSRFRNLLHHHTHSSHPGPASTFWAGCGAIRREVFLAEGGFDAAAYPHPSIEDIELGLRLSDNGALILLDPAIQGTHHKHWILASMVATDIRQRAIPWSRLLLQRRELPATLNLDPSARISGAASLGLSLAVGAVLALPALRVWALVAAASCLALLLLINRRFYILLLRRMGPVGAVCGVGLHAFYFVYSCLTLTLMAVLEIGARPIAVPHGLRRHPGLQRGLLIGALAALALLALAATLNGLLLGWRLRDTDLYERLDEWRLFQAGVYPSHRLATETQQALPHFRTSVYLPWALPLFGLLFGWGGAFQGTLLIQGLSLASLALIAAIGWRTLRPWGRPAAWLGALAPLAIAANSNTLAQGQFSIVCMGLLSLAALLLGRLRPLPAGLCWALAMVKPQIAATFALPLLVRGQRRGLAAGLVLLGLLSGAALWHCRIPPLAYLRTWLAVLPGFIGDGNVNAAAQILAIGQQPTRAAPLMGAALLAMVGMAGLAVWRGLHGQLPRRSAGSILRIALGLNPGEQLRRAWQRDPLSFAGLAAVVGAVGLYHRNVDNIMLFPALLAALRLVLQQRRQADLLLAMLIAASLWSPQRLLDLWSGSALAQSLIWCAVGLRLLPVLLQSAQTQPVAAN